jgi:choline dehydrogenase-like flavoprotein
VWRDFVVVGGGGAGAVDAKELSTAGFQMVVLEQGPYLRPDEFVHDELRFKDPSSPLDIGREVLTI